MTKKLSFNLIETPKEIVETTTTEVVVETNTLVSRYATDMRSQTSVFTSDPVFNIPDLYEVKLYKNDGTCVHSSAIKGKEKLDEFFLKNSLMIENNNLKTVVYKNKQIMDEASVGPGNVSSAIYQQQQRNKNPLNDYKPPINAALQTTSTQVKPVVPTYTALGSGVGSKVGSVPGINTGTPTPTKLAVTASDAKPSDSDRHRAGATGPNTTIGSNNPSTVASGSISASSTAGISGPIHTPNVGRTTTPSTTTSSTSTAVAKPTTSTTTVAKPPVPAATSTAKPASTAPKTFSASKAATSGTKYSTPLPASNPSTGSDAGNSLLSPDAMQAFNKRGAEAAASQKKNYKGAD